MRREVRTADSDFDVRSAEDGGNVLVGYAAKFNTRSQNLGGFIETIAPSAFTNSLSRGLDVRALFNHDPNLVLGRSTAGTLTLSQDQIGLRYRVPLPNTTAGRDLAESLRRGDITQSSFSFEVDPDGDDWDDDNDMPIRTLRSVSLFDVSPVTYPAYLDTNSGIAQRSLANARAMKRPPIPVRDFTAEIESDYATRVALIRLMEGN
ncbi:HK97 family phage prohead protease [Streptacidiphilus albus]|uniref:HK97 family phage prohead protease n=1 Tax=Streptacidiphilus albus TaxID=105425 RepID=UPI0007C77430|nr:HK97 family phage prohead protease [Streptacidiphilus albus]